jgi:hypothetical protein
MGSRRSLLFVAALSLCAIAALAPASTLRERPESSDRRSVRSSDLQRDVRRCVRAEEQRCAGRPVPAAGKPKGLRPQRLDLQPGQLKLKPGQVLRLNNRGGETHSFTEVVDFGGGVIPPLNAVFPPGTPLFVPIGDRGSCRQAPTST